MDAADPDLRRMVVAREGRNVFPDSHLWSAGGAMANLTRNANPFPELASARRVDFSFRRQDGLEVHGNLALPPGTPEGIAWRMLPCLKRSLGPDHVYGNRYPAYETEVIMVTVDGDPVQAAAMINLVELE